MLGRDIESTSPAGERRRARFINDTTCFIIIADTQGPGANMLFSSSVDDTRRFLFTAIKAGRKRTGDGILCQMAYADAGFPFIAITSAIVIGPVAHFHRCDE